ncbi:MAG: lipopolysaccharide biosynthesis protein [Gammaproteobacteria bacterium]|nr:lipopolysaccharide biosynthesis protein [Gammaproteobacteria bacterium]
MIDPNKLKPDSLKSKTIIAVFWSFSEQLSQQGIQFVVTIVLARILLPVEFGLIAMLTVFMAIAQSFINSGFAQALIQKHKTTHVDECTIFYFNVLVGFFAAGLLCVAAPWIAGFYYQPLLIPLTYALSLNLIINAFGLVQTTLLTKRIDFKTQLKVSVIATIISGIIGIMMAFDGFGVWSLVVQSVSCNLLRAGLLWVFNPWRPSLIFSFSSLREMFVFGSRLLASGLISTIFDNIYLAVIGRFFSPVSLGFYSQAEGLQKLPVSNLSNIISRVTFPVFSSIKDDHPRLKRGVRKALSFLVLVNFPLMIGLAIVAEPLVLVLLTEKWLPCVPYLRLLCAVGLLYPLHVMNLNVLTAQGRSDLFFYLEVLKRILVVLAIVITYQGGIVSMIYGQITTSFLAYILNTYYTGKLLDYSFVEQVKDLMPILALSIVMGLVVYVLKYANIVNPLAFLTTQIITGISVYIGLCYIFKISSFMEILALIKSESIKHNYIN